MYYGGSDVYPALGWFSLFFIDWAAELGVGLYPHRYVHFKGRLSMDRYR